MSDPFNISRAEQKTLSCSQLKALDIRPGTIHWGCTCPECAVSFVPWRPDPPAAGPISRVLP